MSALCRRASWRSGMGFSASGNDKRAGGRRLNPTNAETMVVFKPNYNQQRAERNRLKQAKKDAKLREREEAVARRKAGEQEAVPPTEDAESDATRSA